MNTKDRRDLTSSIFHTMEASINAIQKGMSLTQVTDAQDHVGKVFKELLDLVYVISDEENDIKINQEVENKEEIS